MTYLGIQITDDGFTYRCRELPGAYIGLDNLKADIREIVLPSYQPVKTLKWLEDQTGLEWKFYGSTLCQGAMLVYDVHTQLLFSHEGKALITNWSSGEYIEVTPKEFIEKIERGEWI